MLRHQGNNTSGLGGNAPSGEDKNSKDKKVAKFPRSSKEFPTHHVYRKISQSMSSLLHLQRVLAVGSERPPAQTHPRSYRQYILVLDAN